LIDQVAQSNRILFPAKAALIGEPLLALLTIEEQHSIVTIA